MCPLQIVSGNGFENVNRNVKETFSLTLASSVVRLAKSALLYFIIVINLIFVLSLWYID